MVYCENCVIIVAIVYVIKVAAMVSSIKRINWIKGTPLGVSAYSVKSLSTQFYEDVIEIIMCLKGRIDLYCAYEKHELKEGEFVNVDRDVYFLDGGKDCVCASVFIDFKYLAEKYPEMRASMFVCDGRSGHPVTEAQLELQSLVLGLMSYINENLDDNFEEKNDTEKKIAVDIQREGQSSIDIIKLVADKIIKCIVDNFDILYYRVPREAFNDKYKERYHKMNIYLNEHCDEQISLKDLADEFHLTESYVSEMIRKSGLSFKKIMAYIKANKSERLLLTTDDSIAEIADKCGFSDVKLYYAAFREWYRCTPRQFRERYKYGTKDDLKYIKLKNIDKDIMRISMMTHRKRLLL